MTVPHGTASRYTWHGCRCRACTDAQTAMERSSRAKARQRAKEDPALIPHGTVTGYTYWGCRCMACSNASHDRAVARHAAAHAP